MPADVSLLESCRAEHKAHSVPGEQCRDEAVFPRVPALFLAQTQQTPKSALLTGAHILQASLPLVMCLLVRKQGEHPVFGDGVA